MRYFAVALLALSVCLTACGSDPYEAPEMPKWEAPKYEPIKFNTSNPDLTDLEGAEWLREIMRYPTSAEVELYDNFKMRYLYGGDIDKPMIIFLHGFPEIADAWTLYLEDEDLRKNFYMVAPDMRGYGKSEKPHGVANYRADLVARDISMLAKKLGKEEFIVVGHDWGGIIAYITASNHADQVRDLVIFNAPHPQIYCELYTDPESKQYVASTYIREIRSGDRDSSWYLGPKGDGRPMKDFLFGDAISVKDQLEHSDTTWLQKFAVKKSAIFRRLSLGLFGWRWEGRALQYRYEAQWIKDNNLENQLHYYRANSFFADNAKDCYNANGDGGPQYEYKVTAPTHIVWGENDPWLTIENLNGIENYVNLTNLQYTDGNHWSNHESFAEGKALLLEIANPAEGDKLLFEN